LGRVRAQEWAVADFTVGNYVNDFLNFCRPLALRFGIQQLPAHPHRQGFILSRNASFCDRSRWHLTRNSGIAAIEVSFAWILNTADVLVVGGLRNIENGWQAMPKVLMSFRYQNGWHVIFFDGDRRRTLLPRKAFFNSDEAMVEFAYRAGGPKTLEDRNIFVMQMNKKSGEIHLKLTAEQYEKLRRKR
jgi:hypothetical protein